MFHRSPLSLFGWLALGASLGSAALAVVALRLPVVPEGQCPIGETVNLPSGLEGQLCEVLTETQPATAEDWLVVRLVVPGLAPRLLEEGPVDHDWACARYGLGAVIDGAEPPARIVVQLMAEAFPRGAPAPGIMQSIEVYSIRKDACIWELF